LISKLAGGGESGVKELLKAIDVATALNNIKEEWRKEFAT
jgi:hypothetical protein